MKSEKYHANVNQEDHDTSHPDLAFWLIQIVSQAL
jgi:hypothetical protein